jgi:transposase
MAMEIAMSGRQLAALVLADKERLELNSMASRRKTAQALALRARIVLACADGKQNKEVAVELGLAENTVGKWRRRFVQHRVDGLHEDPRSGTPRTIEDERIEAIVVKTLESLPADATHWSSRGMAMASGLSISSVQRIWRAFGLQPHRMETFKLSTDPDFVSKVRDVVGLYVSPPQHAIVLCVDEKSQIQALDRSQPMLPIRPDKLRGAATTTLVTAPHRCSRPSTSPPAASSANAMGAIALPSSASSSTRSRPSCPAISMSISSWTTMPPTRHR